MKVSISSDSLDSLDYKLWPNLIRSGILPGWGQLEQNHQGRAVIFYGLNIYMIFNTVHYYNRYQETKDHAYKVKFYSYLGLSLQAYTLNLLDVIDSYRNRRYQPWPEDLFSDIPMKSPWGAVARSAMLPGWGQLYNESYYKGIIAFGLCFDFARKIVIYEKRYQESGDSSQKERRIINTWYFGLVYFLNMVDAYVDAYMYRFNESMELTYNVVPLENTLTFGVSIVF